MIKTAVLIALLGALLALETFVAAGWWRSRIPEGRARIAGVVVDPDGAPVEAGLWFLPDDAWNDARWITDSRGRFEQLIDPGPLRLLALAPGWTESTELAVDVAPGAELTGLVLRVRRGGTIRGVLQDEDGNPVAGESVGCWHGALQGSCFDAFAETDDRGRFVLERITPGPVQLGPSSSEAVTVPDEGVIEIVLTQSRAKRRR